MYYCKDFDSLSVLSLFEGELLGGVDKLYFDKKMKKLCEIEIVGDDGVKLVLPTKNIYKVGKNAITVKNNQQVLLKQNENDYCVAPIASKVYSINGEFLGTVQEISINEKFLTEKVSMDNGETLDIGALASVGKNVLIFYGKEKPSIKKFNPLKQPKIFKHKEVQVVNTMPTENIKKENVQLSTKQAVVQDSNFLIGRVCTKDIFNFNNELLIKAHAVVNKKNLKEINKFGKLKELMLYLK